MNIFTIVSSAISGCPLGQIFGSLILPVR